MNIHPLLVHFPIGLLATYSLLELSAVLCSTVRRQSWLFGVKSFLLFTGFLGACAALVTGGVARGLLIAEGSLSPVVPVHALFAFATTALYFLLAAAYLMRIFDREGWGDRIVAGHPLLARSWRFKKRFWGYVLDSWLTPLLALAALISITITGALGAAIVYGTSADPLVSFVYRLFFAQ